MKISTTELKRFKNNSSFIKSNKILPILNYLKFEEGKITKTNLQSFIEQEAKFKGTFLVPEMNLFNFLSRSTEEYIDVYVKDGMCIISDGKLPVVKVPTEDVKNFPSTPVPDDNDPIEIENDVFCAINIASNFVDFSDSPDIKCHVFVGDGLVVGMNGWIGYNEKFKSVLPKMVLLKENAMVIGKFNTATYRENDKHIFFDTDNSRFGFLKAAYPYVDLSRFSVIDEGWSKFDVNKNDILDFSETCVMQNVEKTLVGSFSTKGKKLLMSMNEPNYNISVNHDVEIGGALEGELNFNPALLSTLLKHVPDTELTFYQAPKSIQFSSESGFLASLQLMVKQN